MAKNVEEEKKLIAERKAVNYVLWALSNAYESIPDKFKEKFAQLAKELRADYPDARKLEPEQAKKVYQSVVDMLSYAWKFAWYTEQKKYEELNKHLRDRFWLK